MGGPILAVLAVEKMPFFAFQEENLRGLFAVLGYFADTLDAAALAAPVLARIPDCPAEFAAGYLRFHRLRAAAGVPGVLAARAFPPGAAGGTAVPGRGADLAWKRETPDGGAVLILLMPFCGEEQGRTALARLPGGLEMARVRALGGADPIGELAGFLDSLRRSERPVPQSAVERRA
jgi:hypothetical protein